MCGIVGIVGNLPPKEKVEQARDTLKHRGPDDVGLYYDAKASIALGHRRLSIIDLSPAGQQPFFSNDKRFVLVFNGEIYNYPELKRKLKPFYNFKTKTDTEVLLAAYIRWGEKCLDQIQGMFAFAIWDRKKRKLFCARDRLGIKPLYYCIYKNNFYFASEIKAILKSTNILPKLNKYSILDYLSYRYPLGDKTFFQNISSLLPGHYITINRGSALNYKLIKYWDLPIISDKKPLDKKEISQSATELLIKTVDSHLISDVPVGIYLSGGLDSSIVAALMAQQAGKKIKTFSIGFKEKGFHEFKFSRLMATKLQSEHREFTIKAEDYLDLLPGLIKFKDAPISIPNELALYILSKELKKYISVVLSGEGADELFGGYGRIFTSGYDLEKMILFKKGNCLTKSEQKILRINLKQKYGDFDPTGELDHFLNQYSYMKLIQKQKLLNPAMFSLRREDLLNESYFRSFFDKLSPLKTGEKYMYAFQKVHLLGPLHRLDTASMAASVEARVPFVDHKLIEFISALPFEYKIRWQSESSKFKARLLNSDQFSEKYDITKYLLKEISVPYLPKAIIKRKKVGFPVPLDNWFDGKFRNFAKETLLSSKSYSDKLYNRTILKQLLNQKNNHKNNFWGLNIWMLVNIELWMREYKIIL